MSIKVKSQEQLLCHNDVKKEFDDTPKDESRCGPLRKKRLPACLSILCPVCGGPAPDHVHFGGQCCYSCRAFFRRTSVKSVSSFRCRSGKNDCVISSGIKSCIPCRLQKCLQVGMDPSLVRGKKIKNEEGDKKVERDASYSPEMSPSEDETVYYDQIKPIMFPKPSPMASPPLMATGGIPPQEDILKRKAQILKCQGAYLQFQASLLEREAVNTMRVTEERVRVMREMMGSGGMYRGDIGCHPDMWSPVKAGHPVDTGYGRPGYPEYREERIVYHQRPESPLAGPVSQECGVLDADDVDHDGPLDLSVHSSLSSPNLHTQSHNMPRIFFSLSGPRR